MKIQEIKYDSIGKISKAPVVDDQSFSSIDHLQ